MAAGSGLANMHNYFTSIYESRYVSGVVAGMKLNEMIADGKITEDTANLRGGKITPEQANAVARLTQVYINVIKLEVNAGTRVAEIVGK